MKLPGITIQLMLLLASTTSNALSAEYCNPILKYISDKSGIPLQLKITRTAAESSKMIGRSEFDFIYSNAI